MRLLANLREEACAPFADHSHAEPSLCRECANEGFLGGQD
jgi:hypothetical protein